MKFIKTFVHVLKKSLTEPKYYQDILKTSFWFSLKYLLILNLVLMLIESMILTITILPTINKKTELIKNEIIKQSKDFYPRELVMSINKGQLSTNVKEPYFFNPPEIIKLLQKNTSDNILYSNFITIDTKANVEKFREYRTLFLITKDSIVVPDRQKNMKTFRVSQFSNNFNFNLDYAKYNKFYLKTLPYINLLPQIIFLGLIIFIILMPWFGALFLTIGNLFYLLWTTCLFWVFFKIKKKSVTYYQLFRLGMHGITIIILVGTLASLLKIDLGIGLFTSFVVWMVFVFKNINFQSSSE
ncbi:MAG: hypothetical protein COW16_04495 [Sphingomonadales bacterium CG12_big_fil_rev_8_21_14_0_65_65_10]|uniref:DUF1189 domain-containing protein n=3 Tax=Candidatus Roizmaniibacteriota TaxID=1752723 RepID=A0A2M7E3J8_9BACT|nr:MAG: hypothetical protein COW96_00735 [Candidatus Roizmanbacteria bacterium CG22_combo_CG10-13_8_21_14_all_33_16]PIV62295.1 MAG: hypothetical protein COS12_02900 [Candidatus Roizmanbacteria bacterium CG01_land_8_20_14_3_00_33_9]PIW55774.1 MAG: hypothetical protein COW16_04495 [Sphingomonadales bacterium CG12_big_fil_rev_8_21_14_0_65_65_10]PJB89401.1 MAG: hypothetical protein CO083_00760 [Candidatus Roizmanbacteria bacterium CG_4_9_14_0_8_um_filter_34_12]